MITSIAAARKVFAKAQSIRLANGSHWEADGQKISLKAGDTLCARGEMVLMAKNGDGTSAWQYIAEQSRVAGTTVSLYV